MRILVVGSGGREHALAWKLSQEAEVFVSPGNPGIAQCAQCENVAASDLEGVVSLADRLKPDFILVGPEAPLIAGLGDLLRAHGHAVFGPNRDGAQLEGSKAYAKQMMRQAGVPTAESATFNDAELAHQYVARFGGGGVVVKASGEALGKGVFVCDSVEEAHEAIELLMIRRELGEGGSTVVIEERLTGFEFSLLTICNGKEFVSLPVAQDYKRAFDGDAGPNTGGMGSYSPVPRVRAELVEITEKRCVGPLLQTLASECIEYRGVLFTGLMVVEGEPKVLEYNVRFGDPETQSVVLRLGQGLGELLKAAAMGDQLPRVEVLDNAAVTVVIAQASYPSSSAIKPTMKIGPVEPAVEVFHAGSTTVDGQLVASGGRVVNVSAQANSISAARELAYRNVGSIEFEGARFRSDIAQTT